MDTLIIPGVAYKLPGALQQQNWIQRPLPLKTYFSLVFEHDLC